MLLDDGDTALLKTWLIKKLESVADADSDVLADYVLALVKTDDAESVAKANAVDQLRDFLSDDAGQFVNELFAVIDTKSFDPSKPLPTAQNSAAPTDQLPERPSNELPEQLNPGKKRGYHDWDRDELQQGRSNEGNRPMKQAKRGGRGGRQQYSRHGDAHEFAQPMTPPSGPSFFDRNDPIAAFMARQQAMGMLPGFIPTTVDGAPRCISYDTKGHCARGTSCPFEHGDTPYVVPPDEEYNPTQANLLHVQPTRTGIVSTSPQRRFRGSHRGRGSNAGYRGGNKRADFSRQGPNNDKSDTSIVVEQIPEPKFDEQNVRIFFEQFGTIRKVEMQAYKRLAIVTFDSHGSARAAYESPKVVFDNRFVKVYWFKPSNPKVLTEQRAGWLAPNADTDMQDQEPEIDYEEVAKKQEEAQRRHEERKKKVEEAVGRQKALDELEINRKNALAEIAKKTGKTTTAVAESDASSTSEENGKTKALKAQLAKLEAEAKELGIDPETVSTSAFSGADYLYPSSRGRGVYRGRARGRGGYDPSFRRGRQGARGGAVMRLDNRTKTVCIIFNQGLFKDHEEALRQLLLFNPSESASLSKHPDRHDGALIAFEERYLAETFMTTATSPGSTLAGKCELSWYERDARRSSCVDTTISASGNDVNGREASPAPNMDDVAEEGDHWR